MRLQPGRRDEHAFLSLAVRRDALCGVFDALERQVDEVRRRAVDRREGVEHVQDALGGLQSCLHFPFAVELPCAVEQKIHDLRVFRGESHNLFPVSPNEATPVSPID